MTEAIGATGGRKQRIPFSLKLNRLLYFPFTTLWAIAYYIVYFRNPFYLWLIVIALALDVVRLSPRASSRLYAFIVTNKYAILGVIGTLFVLQCWLVVSGAFPQIAFGLSYDHYEAAFSGIPIVYASLIYCVEAVGALASFLVISFYGLECSAEQGRPILERVSLKLAKVNSRKELRKLVMFLSLLYVIQIGSVIITVRSHPKSPYEYHPQTRPLELVLYSASPIFLAIGAAWWLREIAVYNKKQKFD